MTRPECSSTARIRSTFARTARTSTVLPSNTMSPLARTPMLAVGFSLPGSLPVGRKHADRGFLEEHGRDDEEDEEIDHEVEHRRQIDAVRRIVMLGDTELRVHGGKLPSEGARRGAPVLAACLSVRCIIAYQFKVCQTDGTEGARNRE